MKILWESQNWPGSRIEPSINCLSWIPSSSKTGRGLLGVGSESGLVGINYTDITNEPEGPKRHNFNLRGHHSAICIVTWNRSQTKLASCDSGGIIYVWIPNEERWTVELVNDRGVKVRDFNWSPNGELALICYEDNFVLIGSSTGQRVWSNAFLHTILCGAWAPSSQEFCLGTATGAIQVYSQQGILITERTLFATGVRLVAYGTRPDGKWTLAAVSGCSQIDLLNSFYEPEVRGITMLDSIHSIHWNSDGSMLAVVTMSNRVSIFNHRGKLLHSVKVPSKHSLTAFTWAHDDQIMIIAAGGALSIGRVIPGVPSLSQLVSHTIWINMGKNAKQVQELMIPERERQSIAQYDHHIIRCRIPSIESLSSIVCQPSDWRWYCTIVPIPKKPHSFMMCLEHMGGLIPILLGRQVNRIIPQFVISLPPHIQSNELNKMRFETGASAQVEDLNTFLRNSQRNSVWRRSKRQLRRFMSRRVIPRRSKSPPTLVQVQSNVWCTKFKITSVGLDNLPHNLAQVTYKTSVLHLQPRQMTIHLCDLKNSPTPETPSTTMSRTSSIRRSMDPSRQRNAACNTSPVPTRARSASSATENTSVNTMAVAPVSTLSDGIIAVQNYGGDEEPLLNNNLSELLNLEGEDEELMAEERVLLHNVLSEFDSLKDAVNNHIKKMKEFAHQLEVSTTQIACSKKQHSSTTRTLIQPVLSRTRTSLDTPVELLREDRPTTSRQLSLSESELRWQSCVDAFDYIDEDESIIVPETADSTPLLSQPTGSSTPPASQTSTLKKPEDSLPKRHQKQLNDIRLVVEKLSALANELSSRLPSSNFIDTGRLRLGNNTVGSKTMNPPTMENFTNNTSVSVLRDQVCDIARQVAQLEEKIKIDNLLKEIRCDLQQRIQHIKSVLGETSSNVDGEIEVLSSSPMVKGQASRETGNMDEANYRTLTMTNKTPFWNEQAQVYQLDFGGRVTQESAKNFQIEYQTEQVMQFGRIENGAYTLDFSKPFCAIQAFGIALASITQRLK